jgi:hypothetical protein
VYCENAPATVSGSPPELANGRECSKRGDGDQAARSAGSVRTGRAWSAGAAAEQAHGLGVSMAITARCCRGAGAKRPPQRAGPAILGGVGAIDAGALVPMMHTHERGDAIERGSRLSQGGRSTRTSSSTCSDATRNWHSAWSSCRRRRSPQRRATTSTPTSTRWATRARGRSRTLRGWRLAGGRGPFSQGAPRMRVRQWRPPTAILCRRPDHGARLRLSYCFGGRSRVLFE